MFAFCLFKQKKHLSVFLVLTMLFFVKNSIAESYIVVDLDTSKVINRHEAFKRWYPASLTKLMTAYLAFDALRLGKFTISTPVYISDHAKSVVPVRSKYKAGTYIPFISALQLILVHSTNDLAVALAEAIGGNEDNFVLQMNEMTKKIGMMRTHFMNPHGLFDKNHYSTAYDIALLATKIRQDFPQYAHFFKIQGLEMQNSRRIIKNSNNLLGRFEGADGLKTGFTCASGYNLAASATRDEKTLVAIVLGAQTIEDRELLTAQLLEEGFENKKDLSETLSSLQKEELNSDWNKVPDMRSFACGQAARKKNAPYVNSKKKAVFPSPYLSENLELKNIIPIKTFE